MNCSLALNRRAFLRGAGGGFGMMAILDLLASEGAGRATGPRAMATSVIDLFMYGGPSQVDTFDPKPELTRHAGEPMPGDRPEVFFGRPGPLMASPFRFDRHGESGHWVSELFPEIAGVVDRIAFLKGMRADSNNHAPALFQMNTGRPRPGNPSLGAWASYGLGSINRNLPAFVVLADDRGGPIGGAPNWGSGYMPATFAGVTIRGDGPAIIGLEPPGRVAEGRERATRALIRTLDEGYRADHGDDPAITARIEARELAFRMQAEAPEAVDLSRESDATRTLYGLDDPATAGFGRRVLIARRLVERGVRFVQVYHGRGGNFDDLNWDAHNDLARNHRAHARATDRPVAGLIRDLRSRGLLDSTLVLWGGEFGRMPVSQGGLGRDHNPHGFTRWMAGGGVRGGVSVGATDAFGYKAVDQPCHVNDWHATVLHLLGVDHTGLTYPHEGRPKRLTDVAGRVMTEVLGNRAR